MNHILSYFPAYRALLRDVQEFAARQIFAEEQARLWRGRCEAAEDREQEALNSEQRSLKMVANCEAIRSGSPIVPFPDVYVPMPEPPSSGEAELPAPRKRHAHDVVRDMEREFREEYGAQLDRELSE